jgi:hypothetical protein
VAKPIQANIQANTKTTFTLLINAFYVAAPGSQWRDPTNPSATSADKRAISPSCSQQADAKGLHGEAREAFRSQCELAKAKAQ